MSLFIGTSESWRSSSMRWQSHCHFNQVWQHQFAVTAKKKTAKKCTAHSEFLFCLCSCFCCHSGSADLASSNTKTLENMQQNRHPHIPTQRPIHELVSFHNYIIPDCISYQVICMWENKQRLGRQITSTAECGCSFQSLQIITCNIKHLQKLKCTDISPTNTLYWSTTG